jgi:hypothetical protein
MQKIFKNSKKITRGARHDIKDNRSGFGILSFFKKSYSFYKLAGSKTKNALKPYQTA